MRTALSLALAVALAGCGTPVPAGTPVVPAGGDTRRAALGDRGGDGRLEPVGGEPLVARGGAAGATTADIMTNRPIKANRRILRTSCSLNR